jgi:diketogulonate reductase-like aldo/keto reductase
VREHPFGSGGRLVPVCGYGTWYIEQAGGRSVVAAIRRSIDLGASHIDTAEMYGSGASERIVGEAIAGRRDEVFLVSKVLPQNASRRGVRAACEASLRRLGTDYLDCYLLHWPGSHPIAETVAGFEELRLEGKIARWGVSNFDVDDLEELWPFATEGGPSCNQVLYHLKERAIEHAVLPWCESRGVAVVAYSPFGHGDFPGLTTAGGRLLVQIAAAHNATPRQVALAFLTRRPSLFAIPKASNLAHAEENAGAGDLQLSAAEIALIETAFPRGPRPMTLPML